MSIFEKNKINLGQTYDFAIILRPQLRHLNINLYYKLAITLIIILRQFMTLTGSQALSMSRGKI